MSDAAIRTALEARAATAAGWPATAWARENKAYTPVRGTPWVRTTMAWGAEQLESLPAAGGRVERTGILQLEYFGLVDQDSTAADAWIAAVRAVFPVGAFIAVAGGLYCRIDRIRRWVADRDDRNWHHQPLDVEWTLNYNNPTSL